MALLIRECHNDLEEVEAKVRALTPKTTSIRKRMQPFRDLYTKIQKGVVTSVDVRSLLT